MPRQQESGLSTAPIETAATDLAAPSTGSQTESGNAAVSRIAGADEDTLPSYGQVLAEILGPVAAEISPSDVPPEVAAVAAQAIQLATSTAASQTTATPATAPAAKSAPHATAAKADASIPAEITAVKNEIDAFIAEKIASVLALTPQGQALSQKFLAFDKAHPGLILEALVLAAIAATGRDLKIPELNHTFKLGDSLSVKGGVNVGSLRHIMVKAINASIEYKKGNFDAQASASHDFSTKSSTFSAQFSDKDIDLLGFKIDEALASFNHTSPAGKPPTDTLRFQLKTAIAGANLTLGESNTWSPATPAKGPAGRQLNQQLTEDVALPAFDGMKVSLNASESFGRNHAQDTVGAKLALPAWHDIAVTIGEQMPFGPGSGKPVTTVSAVYKGVTFTLSHGGTARAEVTTLDTSGAGYAHGTWSIGIKIPFGG